VTWWDQAAGPWLSYVNRCQALLQSGLFVADVLYYNGDGAPNMVDVKHVDPPLGKGYDYDVCNAEVLLTRLSVKKGRLVLPDGMSYRVLVLPDSKRMPVEVAQKIRALVKAGATIVGPRPESDPGLKNYPQCDVEVKKIATEVWGENSNIEHPTSNVQHPTVERSVGKGRVFWGKPLREILMADGVSPDFQHSGDAFIDFIHRATADTEFYFLANRKGGAVTVEATFRVSDRQPELWDPVTGTMRDLQQYSTTNGCTTVSLTFESYGSMFVVFRREVKSEKLKVKSEGQTNFWKFKSVQEITGSWTVQFNPQWYYPADGLSGDQVKGLLFFDKLEDWSKRPESAVKHFSGTAVYRKTFDFPEPRPVRRSLDEGGTLNPLFLDLGVVKETARVKLNGKDLGVVWCVPWRVEITGAVKAGANALEIEVVNLWPNRLIGDDALPEAQRKTRTNIGFNKAHPLLSSGLLGPVRVMVAE